MKAHGYVLGPGLSKLSGFVMDFHQQTLAILQPVDSFTNAGGNNW
jgi:hypothetical protein